MVLYQYDQTLRLKLGLLLSGSPDDLKALLDNLKASGNIRIIYEKLSTRPLTIIEKMGGE